MCFQQISLSIFDNILNKLIRNIKKLVNTALNHLLDQVYFKMKLNQLNSNKKVFKLFFIFFKNIK
jgi:hypothetical protein